MQSANVFISYRRDDSVGHAGRLFDHLNGRLPGRVFMDLDTLDPGAEFSQVIRQAVGSCKVLIAVIGREWLTVTDAAGQRRLHQPGDYVRLELATALARDVLVIPVLVQDASMPQMVDLPADLVKLAGRHAIELSDARWAYDVDRLIQKIEEVLDEPGPPANGEPDAPSSPAPRWRNLGRSVTGFGLAAAPLLLASPLPFPIRPVTPVLAVAMGLLAAAVASRTAERISGAVARRRWRYFLGATVIGLVWIVIQRDVFTVPVRVGSTSISVLIGPGPSERLSGCPCPETWTNQQCIRGLISASTVNSCWGPLGRLLFGAAYLFLTLGWGGFIGLTVLRRKATERTTAVSRPLLQ